MHGVRQAEDEGPQYPVALQNVDVSQAEHWRSTAMAQWIPRSGLDFLRGADQLDIQQTIELHDLLASVESENRFLVRVPGGETLFVAAEESSASQRLCFGSSRAFNMRIVDAGRQEALRLRRRLACRFGLLGCCFLQDMEVKTRRGAYLGRVTQNWTLFYPELSVKDDQDNIIYRIQGPQTWFFCGPIKDVSFKILSADGVTEKGNILHCWRGDLASYCITVTFPRDIAGSEHKALLLSAALLLQYMFFEQTKRRGCSCLL